MTNIRLPMPSLEREDGKKETESRPSVKQGGEKKTAGMLRAGPKAQKGGTGADKKNACGNFHGTGGKGKKGGGELLSQSRDS